MLTLLPSFVKQREALEQAQADLAAVQKELSQAKALHAATMQIAHEETRRLRQLLKESQDEAAVLRASVTGTSMRLHAAEGKLAGARGRSMRKEKMAQKKIDEINQSI